jgi:hypothetical protein
MNYYYFNHNGAASMLLLLGVFAERLTVAKL